METIASSVQHLGAPLLAVMELTSHAHAFAVYDASILLSVLARPKPPGGVVLFFFPGATVTPPPSSPVELEDPFSAATRDAAAPISDQMFAAVHGIRARASSYAGAFGYWSLVNPHCFAVEFPIAISEGWSASTICAHDANSAGTTVRARVLLYEIQLFNLDRRSVLSASGSV